MHACVPGRSNLSTFLVSAILTGLASLGLSESANAFGDLPPASESTGCLVAAITELPAGSNQIVGTPCDDLIVVPAGTDKVRAGGGNDIIIGTRSLETIDGGSGDDLIYADHTRYAFGGANDDTIFGNAPSQSNEGQAALDRAIRMFERALGSTTVATALASSGESPGVIPMAVHISGDQYDNIIHGGHGNEYIDGKGGNDQLFGDIGDDTIYGDLGDDLVAGGHGGDTVDGGEGSDWVRGDGTPDRIKDTSLSNSGDVDVLSYATGITPGFTSPDPNLTNFPSTSGERGLYLKMPSPNAPTTGKADNGTAGDGGGADRTNDPDTDLAAFEVIVGTPFADYIIGSDQNDVIYGGGGTDKIEGLGGDDTVYGGAGSDHLNGGSGSNVIRGDAGLDYCENGSTMTSCNESLSGSDRVIPRSTSTIAVGLQSEMTGTAQDNRFAELYVKGSEGNDNISLSYWYPGGNVHFVTITLASGSFDPSSNEQTAGCDYDGVSSSPPTVVCTFRDNQDLDAVTLAGMGGSDSLDVQTAQFPLETSLTMLGGSGSDQLHGGYGYEVLVDGAGNDTLWGETKDDGLINGLGSDTLYAGAGDDLLLTTSLCDGTDYLGGGNQGEDNNASWLQAKSGTLGVAADIASQEFGEYKPGVGVTCSPMTNIGTLVNIQNLEGTGREDFLGGNSGSNGIIGWLGGDVLSGREGADTVTGYAPSSSSSVAAPGPDKDSVYGGEGDDHLHVDDGQTENLINCGSGIDDGVRDQVDWSSNSIPAGCEDHEFTVRP